jgi:hypothetical protein
MRNRIFMIAFLFNQAVQGQERKGFEGYYFPANGGGISSMSVKLFDQASQGWYTECRYNYEEERTAGFSVGKTFSKEDAFSYSITPEVGFAVGKLQGASLGLNSSLSCKRLSFNSSLLYTAGFEWEEAEYSLFNWTELNVQINRYLYAGATVQLSCSGHTVNSGEPGVQLGVMFQGWAFPLYVFDRPGTHPYFAAGACYEWKK